MTWWTILIVGIITGLLARLVLFRFFFGLSMFPLGFHELLVVGIEGVAAAGVFWLIWSRGRDHITTSA